MVLASALAHQLSKPAFSSKAPSNGILSVVDVFTAAAVPFALIWITPALLER